MEIPEKVAKRIRRMAKRIAHKNYWTGDKTEMALDLEQEGLIGYLTSGATDDRRLNSDIRRAMVDHLLKWCYGVTHRQSESLKTVTVTLEPAERNNLVDQAPRADECVYVNQVVDIATAKLAPACRVVKLSSYRAMIRAMIDNGDPYLTGEAGPKGVGLATSTAAFMKKKIQLAFREALAA